MRTCEVKKLLENEFKRENVQLEEIFQKFDELESLEIVNQIFDLGCSDSLLFFKWLDIYCWLVLTDSFLEHILLNDFGFSDDILALLDGVFALDAWNVIDYQFYKLRLVVFHEIKCTF